jgi:hypothetical protein
MADTLSKETYLDLVADVGGGQEFLYAIYKKVIQLTAEVEGLAARLEHLELGTIDHRTVDAWLKQAVQNQPPEEEDGQMLGDLVSISDGRSWYHLHPNCPSWPVVKQLRSKIVAAARAHGLYPSAGDLLANSVESAVKRNAEFRPYRDWVHQTSRPDPSDWGLDPWSYIPGLELLAGPASDPRHLCLFVEIRQEGGKI